MKKGIKDFKDGLDVIRKIHTVTYKYNGIGDLPNDSTNIGIIAQEVQQVAPYCIGKSRILIKDSDKQTFVNNITGSAIKDSTGQDHYVAEVLSFNPNGLFFAMLNSIKELDSTVTAIKKELGSQRLMNNGGQGSNENTLQVELANNREVILYQNEPNPFDGSTVIRYFIPENITGEANITFSDIYGKEIKKLEISQKGFGKIEANTENLAAGIYSYSIVVNDRIIDTKKMMRNK